MRINKALVPQQIELMVGRLFREKHLDIPMTSRTKITRQIEGIVNNYLRQLSDIEAEARQILLDNDIQGDPAAFRRAVSMLTEKEDFPLGDEALRYLNRKIQAFLWDSDEIEEIYSDEPQLTECIRTYLLGTTR